MADEFFTDMLSTKMTINSVAGVANMSTTSYIIWVKNIQTDNLSSIRIAMAWAVSSSVNDLNWMSMFLLFSEKKLSLL